MKKNTKIVVLALALALALVCAIGGTIAWLTAGTTVIKNTFTDSDVGVTLEETENDFQMIPGHTIDKDPKVTVTEGSEDCFLFVKIDKSAKLDDYITYAVADGWTQLKNGEVVVEGVFYREVKKADTVRTFSVLKEDEVTVKGTVTKAMMDDVEANKDLVTLSFTAYVSQMYETQDKPFTAFDAWKNVNPNTDNSTDSSEG